MNNQIISKLLTVILLTTGLFSAINTEAENEITVASKIKKVNVFVNRAQVERSASASIKPGITNIVLSGLTTKLDLNSIQVEGKGDFVLMSVKYQTDYLNKNSSSEQAKTIQKQLDALQLDNKKLNSRKQVLSEEKQLLLSNQVIAGKKNGLTAAELQNNTSYFRTRRNEIEKLYIDYDLKTQENQEKIRDLQNQLNEINRNQNTASGSIVVSVASKSTQNVTLDFDYIVYSAGWTPYYDIRAEEGKETVQLNYKAKIRQYTGVDWNNVLISVSTGNPAQGGNKPDLSAWYINAYDPGLVSAKPKSYKARRSAAAPSYSKEEAYDEDYGSMDDSEIEEEEAFEPASNSADYTSVTESDLAVTFDIALKQSIPSDNKDYTVDIRDFDVKAGYAHAAIPKMDLDAFLVANLTEYSGLNLLSGNGNVFYDGAYVGKTYIDLKNTSDTLEVSLGRDKKVIITRDKIKNYCKTRTIGANTKRSVGYEINIRNTKKQTISLTLEDQIPISNNSQVEVELVKDSGGKLDEKTKKITWYLELKPGESKKLELKFDVKYPKKYTFSNL